jgi:S1-C subfamily serine protease
MNIKYLNILTILFFASVSLKAQCLNNKDAFENHFETNFSHLNQIEGFWSVTVNLKLYFENELVRNVSKYQVSEWAIIRAGEIFRACEVNGNNPLSNILEFTPTANPNIYLYKKTYSGEITTAIATLTNIGLLTYSREMKQNELKTMMQDEYEIGIEGILQFTLIKTFPTQETFQEKRKCTGTGFAISIDGVIVTCNHIIEKAKNISVRGINSDFIKTYNAKIVSSDNNNDIAIIQIDDPSFSSIESIPYNLADKTAEVGSAVFALGYPFLSTMGEEIKLTDGIVSANSGYKGDITLYQVSVPVQPGNSGGPLFDNGGNVVGIVNAKIPEAENVSYAVKISYLKNLLESLSLNSNLTTLNTLSTMTLPEKVKVLRNFIYIIETECE